MSAYHIPHLTGYCDADWVVFPNTRRLVTCFVFEVWWFSHYWKSKKRNTVHRSSAEAECRSLSSLACQVVWIAELFMELNVKLIKSSSVFCDIKVAIYIGANLVFHERTHRLWLSFHLRNDSERTQDNLHQHLRLKRLFSYYGFRKDTT